MQFVGQRVFECREAVDDRREIGVQLAGAFDGQQHALLAAGLGEPQALVTARLLIDLDHPRAYAFIRRTCRRASSRLSTSA